MSNQDDTNKNNQGEKVVAVPHIKPSILWVFLIIALLTLIFGFFSILSVLIDSIQHNQINYPDAIIIGSLLVFGGIFLLGGTIIMKNWAPLQQVDTQDNTSDIKE
ncbi:MAG: hypothetical protein ACTSRJ_06330 [Candidatus Hodarchaeales archaeon]